jgi:hypothetical protein
MVARASTLSTVPSAARHPQVSDVRVVLVHSPITDRDVWLPVAERLRALSCQVLVPRLADRGRSPFWEDHVAAVISAISDYAGAASPLVLVVHSGAGQLADHLVAELDSLGHTVEAVVYADAALPPVGSRLSQLRQEAPEVAADLVARLMAGQRFPDWTDAQLRPLVPDGARRRRLLDGVRTMPLDGTTGRSSTCGPTTTSCRWPTRSWWPRPSSVWSTCCSTCPTGAPWGGSTRPQRSARTEPPVRSPAWLVDLPRIWG